MLPPTLRVRAQRVRLPNTAAGETKLVRIGAPLNTLPVLSRTGNHFDNNKGTVYTYSTGETKAWKISTLKGRWLLSINTDDGASDKTQFKIDKRSQIAGAALAWAAYWPNRPESSKKYLRGTLNEAVYLTPDGQELFTQCHSFAGYIYNRHGLYNDYNSDIVCASLPGKMTATDDGVGSLRMFTAHTGVTTGRGMLFGGQMVDINNPEEPEGEKGLKLHSWNFRGDLDARPNRTVPDPSNVTDPVTGRPKSWLKTLDEE